MRLDEVVNLIQRRLFNIRIHFHLFFFYFLGGLNMLDNYQIVVALKQAIIKLLNFVK